jgi:hypothetical protein
MLPRATSEFHVNDYGTVWEWEVRSGRNTVVDLSQICGAELMMMRPDGSAFSRPLQLFPSEESGLPEGTDGLLFYVLQPGDLTEAGQWFLQVFIAFLTGGWYSSVVPIVVFPNLIDINAEQLSP